MILPIKDCTYKREHPNPTLPSASEPPKMKNNHPDIGLEGRISLFFGGSRASSSKLDPGSTVMVDAGGFSNRNGSTPEPKP